MEFREDPKTCGNTNASGLFAAGESWTRGCSRKAASDVPRLYLVNTPEDG
jgi:hypothetical protein